MALPNWMQPVAIGMAAGAAVVAIVGFGFAGWMTGTASATMSNSASETAVASALTPYCVERSTTDPAGPEVLAKLKEASGYQKRGIIEDAGWATPLGSDKIHRPLAESCQAALEKTM